MFNIFYNKFINRLVNILVYITIGVLLSLIIFSDNWNVKAESYFTNLGHVIQVPRNDDYIGVTLNGLAKDYGRSVVTFSFALYGTNVGGSIWQRPVRGVNVNVSGKAFVCNIGSTGGISTSSTSSSYVTYTAICDVEIPSSGLTKIEIFMSDTQASSSTSVNEYIHFSQYMTIIKNSNNNGNVSVDMSEVVTSIQNANIDIVNNMTSLTNQQTQALINAINNIGDIEQFIKDANIDIVNNMTSQNNKIKDSINDVNNSLTNDEIDNNSTTTQTNQWSSYNTQNGTITNLLTMPITLMTAYVSGMNSTCSTISLGNLFGENLNLPCVNIGSFLGAWWNVIDILISGFMIFNIGKKLIRIFNDFTNLKSNQVDDLYGGGI